MVELVATWTKVLSSPVLQRSSHSIVAHNGKVYIFGGELKPREPRDNDILVVDVNAAQPQAVTLQTTAGSTSDTTHFADGNGGPVPRVGHVAAAVNGKMYVHSGRGGVAMAPLTSERGTVWSIPLHDDAPEWHPLAVNNDEHSPEPRSYHAIAADPSTSSLYIHAGCPESGRLSDFWRFDLQTEKWRELPPSPGPARGGPSLAFSDGRVYRLNGFDGKHEVGGVLDVYDSKSDEWSSVEFKADGENGPAARSVGALLPLSVAGKAYLVTLFGEGDPSALGHAGAGKMFSDAWAWDITAKSWSNIVQQGDQKPPPRGWFAASTLARDTCVVQGGLAENNERLDDLWTFRLTAE